jgi:hypothetical protein
MRQLRPGSSSAARCSCGVVCDCLPELQSERPRFVALMCDLETKQQKGPAATTPRAESTGPRAGVRSPVAVILCRHHDVLLTLTPLHSLPGSPVWLGLQRGARYVDCIAWPSSSPVCFRHWHVLVTADWRAVIVSVHCHGVEQFYIHCNTRPLPLAATCHGPVAAGPSNHRQAYGPASTSVNLKMIRID